MAWFKKLLKGSDGALDLTASIAQARRGFLRDVKALCKNLREGALYLPLAKAVRADSRNREGQLEVPAGTRLSSYLLRNEKTLEFSTVLFTQPAFMEPCIEQYQWTTDGGPLRYLGMPALTALRFIHQDLASERARYLVINPEHDTALWLARHEVEALLEQRPVPLCHYIREAPLQPWEKIDMRKRNLAELPGLAKAIEGYTKSHPELIGFELVQLFNAERDVKPHWGLNIKTRSAANEAELVQELRVLLGEILPPSEYVDFMFNAR